MVVNLSGRGDKDLDSVASYLSAKTRGASSRQDASSMSRHRTTLRRAEAEGRAGLVTFITAGDPDYAHLASSCSKALPQAGADVIELGMPFSDPMADGPAIQASSQRAAAVRPDHGKDARPWLSPSAKAMQPPPSC